MRSRKLEPRKLNLCWFQIECVSHIKKPPDASRWTVVHSEIRRLISSVKKCKSEQSVEKHALVGAS